MKWLLRRISARILLVVASAFGVFWAFETVWGAQRLAGGAGMSTQMKTVCVGRFLIDVPDNAQVSIGSAAIDGLNVIHYGRETLEQFSDRTRRREEEINAEKNRAGLKNMESLLEIHQDTVHGKIFVFNREASYYLSNVKKIPTLTVSINGYAHVNGVSLGFMASVYKPEDALGVARLFAQLQPMTEGSFSRQPGFCLDGVFLRDPLTADQGEHIVMFAGMPGHEDLGIGMATMAGKTPGPGLIERHKANRTGAYAFLNLMTSTLLEGPRSINGIEGEEFAFKAREWNLSTGYAFNWETQGAEDNVLHPFVSLEFQTGNSPRAGGDPVQSTLSEQSLADLWRRISSSLRLRPVEQPGKADVGMQPGTVLPQASYQLPAGGIAPRPHNAQSIRRQASRQLMRPAPPDLPVQPVDSTALAFPAGAVTPA